MREILFRGKCAITGLWVYGDYGRVIAQVHNGEVGGMSADCEVLLHYIAPLGTVESLVHEDTVGQFTGLLDMNGNRIFEGDLLVTDNSLEIYQVLYVNEDAMFSLDCNNATLHFGNENSVWYSIFGNIHENREVDNV
jgi:hypothetical protein